MDCDDLTIRPLAHELNSLLDGALRWLSLAEHSARALPDTVHIQRDQLADRHLAAQEALERMAELLQRALSTSDTDPAIWASRHGLAEEIDNLFSLLTPQCRQHGIELRQHLDPAAADLPAGLLAPVLLNGLRNAVESCSGPGLASRRVTVSVTLEAANELLMLIEDTGRGLPDALVIGETSKTHGHGIGLALSRALISRCGGRIELTNVPYGGGAVLSVRVDPTRLTRTETDAA